ncbi:hypothetical protein [Acinetobacter sp.]|uniref:hypothetical protein n=1 Tax=Acinetobacter sp. TaxID=472 RepID=UPI0025C5DCCA|nr:hypothetical protein [Acinetobacter sp.]
MLSFDIDYAFIGNAVTAQTQMMGMLKDNQFLEVIKITHDEDDLLFNVVCNIREEKVN